MNYYVNIINEVINYIEDNIHEKMSLEDISKHFSVSKFHFNRIFKTVAGITLKQYILGRKLTRARQYLTETDESIINTAYSYGFEYPEVFSRAFKKQFGVSPSLCRIENIDMNLVEKAKVVERDIVNYKGTLALNGTCVYMNELNLTGIYVEVDVNDENAIKDTGKILITAELAEYYGFIDTNGKQPKSLRTELWK
jgi:AraC family transcriptional regulator